MALVSSCKICGWTVPTCTLGYQSQHRKAVRLGMELVGGVKMEGRPRVGYPKMPRSGKEIQGTQEFLIDPKLPGPYESRSKFRIHLTILKFDV